MKSFIIRKGNHYCFHPIKVHYKLRRIVFDFILTDSCIYNLNSVDQFDWNKLFGVSFGFNHHKNSYRIGWRWDIVSEKFQLCHYYYNHGVRNEVPMVAINPNQQYRIYTNIDHSQIWSQLYTVENLYNMTKYETIYSDGISFDFNKVPKYGFLLWPFFGGNEVTTQDTKLFLNYF